MDQEWFRKSEEKVQLAYTKTQDAKTIVEAALDKDKEINVFMNIHQEKKEVDELFRTLLTALGGQKEELRKQVGATEEAYNADRSLLKEKMDLLVEQLTTLQDGTSTIETGDETSNALDLISQDERKDPTIDKVVLEASKEYVNSGAHEKAHESETLTAGDLIEFADSNKYVKSTKAGTATAFRDADVDPGWGTGILSSLQIAEHGTELAGIQFTPDSTTELAMFTIALAPPDETEADPTKRKSESLVFSENSVMVVWPDAPGGAVEEMKFEYNKPGLNNVFSISVNTAGRLEYRKNDVKFFTGHWPVKFPLKMYFASSTENVRVADARWLHRALPDETTLIDATDGTTAAP